MFWWSRAFEKQVCSVIQSNNQAEAGLGIRLARNWWQIDKVSGEG